MSNILQELATAAPHFRYVKTLTMKNAGIVAVYTTCNKAILLPKVKKNRYAGYKKFFTAKGFDTYVFNGKTISKVYNVCPICGVDFVNVEDLDNHKCSN